MVNSMVQWLLTSILVTMHPFYVSMIDINHNAKDATAEVSIRIFTQDLEATLQKYSTSKIDVSHPVDKALLDQKINQYLQQKIQISINDQPAPIQYLGYEIQMESVWIYYEIPKISQIKKLELNCSLLYDYQILQSNIIHVKSKGVEKSFKLDCPKSKALFEF